MEDTSPTNPPYCNLVLFKSNGGIKVLLTNKLKCLRLTFSGNQ